MAKVNFSSARQSDSSLYHCLMSGLSGFFQKSAIVFLACRRQYVIILLSLLLILKLLGNIPRSQDTQLWTDARAARWEYLLRLSEIIYQVLLSKFSLFLGRSLLYWIHSLYIEDEPDREDEDSAWGSITRAFWQVFDLANLATKSLPRHVFTNVSLNV